MTSFGCEKRRDGGVSVKQVETKKKEKKREKKRKKTREKEVRMLKRRRRKSTRSGGVDLLSDTGVYRGRS